MTIKPGDGKRTIAPCGHPGEIIVGQFVVCLGGCEVNAEDFPEVEFCPYCLKNEVDTEFELDPIYYMWNPSAERMNRRCWSCGGVWKKT